MQADFHHILHHGGVIIDRVTQPLEGEHIPDFPDHGADIDPQWIIPVGRVKSTKSLDIHLAPFQPESLGFDLFPVVGRFNRGADIVGDGIVGVLGYLSETDRLD